VSLTHSVHLDLARMFPEDRSMRGFVLRWFRPRWIAYTTAKGEPRVQIDGFASRVEWVVGAVAERYHLDGITRRPSTLGAGRTCWTLEITGKKASTRP